MKTGGERNQLFRGEIELSGLMMNLIFLWQLGRHHAHGDFVMPEAIRDDGAMQEPIPQGTGSNSRVAFLVYAPPAEGMDAFHPEGS
jgi:hypothetical protein